MENNFLTQYFALKALAFPDYHSRKTQESLEHSERKKF